jgi:hypothetical protein
MWSSKTGAAMRAGYLWAPQLHIVFGHRNIERQCEHDALTQRNRAYKFDQRVARLPCR